MDSSFTLLSRQRCRWVAGATLTVAIAGSPFVVPSPAQAVGTGMIQVHVASTTGADLAGQSVALYSTATGLPVDTGTTDGLGDAVFTDLDEGGYTARVAASSSYHEKYSTVVTIDGDGDVEFASVNLLPIGITQGRIAGTVSKLDNALDAEIQIFPSTATNASVTSGDTEPVAFASAYDYEYYGDGTVQDDWAAKLPPGSYKVLVGDDDTPETVCHGYMGYYGCYGWSEHESQVWVGSGAPNDANNAGVFVVTAAQTRSTGSVTLAPDEDPPADPARIGGTVTGAASAPLDEVVVRLLQQQPDLSWEVVASDMTGAEGTFGFTTIYDQETYDEIPVPAGVYTVSFEDSRNEYRTEFHDDKATGDPYNPPVDAATVTLGASGTSTVNAALDVVPIDLSSGLNGKVTNDLAVGHPGSIEVYDTYGNYVLGTETRRNGSWSTPATQLAPGSYKVRAEDGVDVSGWYGGATYKVGTTFTVPVKGAKAAGNSKLLRYGSITGTIGLATAPGDVTERYVGLYDADGERIDGTETATNGAYSFPRQRPGTYYVVATGERYSSFDESDLQISRLKYIKQYWKGKFTLGTATPITVASGGNVTGVNVTLGRTLKAVTAPSIVRPSTIKVGSILKSRVGTWNVRTGLTYKYVWKRGTKVVGRSSSYKVVRGDKGKTLTLTVTATDTTKEYLTGSATSKGVKVPS